MIPQNNLNEPRTADDDNEALYKKVVKEMLRRQSTSELSPLDNGPKRVPIMGRKGLDTVEDGSSSLDANTISLLIRRLQAEEAKLLGQTPDAPNNNNNRLSRSFSMPVESSPLGLKPMNMERYKTELCRQFQETGFCKYASKCQFAHGYKELRNTSRHPKYKTDLCRTYHTSGICPYGTRCHFIHDEDDLKLGMISHQKQQQVLMQIRQYRAMNRARSPMSPTSSVGSGSSRHFKSLAYSDVAMSMSSNGSDTPPSSLSSSPAPSPTTFLYEERYHSAPTPLLSEVAQFSLSEAAQLAFESVCDDVFSYCDLPDRFSPEHARIPSPLNIHIPCDPMASLAAGLQAAVPKGEDIIKDCMADFFMFPATSPTQHQQRGDSVGDVSSPMDISKSLRLPIFSQLYKTE